MIRRELYEQVGGMDEALAMAFNDVEFCIRVSQAGCRNVFTPYAELFHFESKSRGYVDNEETRRRQNQEAEYVRDIRGETLFHDPYYNLDLTLVRNDFTVKTWRDREIELTFRVKEKVFT